MLKKNLELPMYAIFEAVIILILIVSVFPNIILAQSSSNSSLICSVPVNAARNKYRDIRYFTSFELMSRLIRSESVIRPPSLGQNNLVGKVTIGIVVGEDGKVICTEPIEGNPIGLYAAEKSVKAWRFRPYTSNSKKRRSMIGQIKVAYDFR